MAELVKIADNHTGYFKVMETLFECGVEQESRNGKTLEIQDLIIEVENPLLAAPIGVRSNYNDAIGVVEGLQFIAGISDSALTAEIQPQFRNYLEPGTGKFHGAYGRRTRDQFPAIIERLRANPDTRQAVITLWNPELDAVQNGKLDYPCTSMLVFMVRGGKLFMKVMMRSADLRWGWPYDAVQFSMVQHTAASVLNLEVGSLTLHAVSAHLYEPHWADARNELDARQVTHEAQPILHFTGDTWEDARQQAFETYRVVTGSLSAKTLKSPSQQAIAQQLMTRRLVIAQKNLEAVKNLDIW